MKSQREVSMYDSVTYLFVSYHLLLVTCIYTIQCVNKVRGGGVNL